ncbi:MAG: hypothetical protein JXA57_15025 [Armatimonadetes bacterium]|nr:hypothetical protein [Armatimonadota bacterium]
MAVTQRDYPDELVRAAKSVLIELSRLLQEYRDDIVVVGGWVPELLFSRHVGSIDVDLALNHRHLGEAGYRTIEQHLQTKGYRRDDEQPFIFRRPMNVSGRTIEVEVDLLAGRYEGTSDKHRTQKVLGVRARKVPGCDLVFDLCTEIDIDGVLPDGGKATATVRVAQVVPFIVMKGMALPRGKEKDSWDIEFCLRSYPGGLEALVEAFGPHLKRQVVQEGLKKIAAEFASVDHMGPQHVADFEGILDPEDRALRVREAYERVSYVLGRLRIPLS